MKLLMIAHDEKKNLMINLCVAYKHILSSHEIYATGTTGQSVEMHTGLRIHKLMAGELGGVLQVCSLLESNEIDAVIYLRAQGNGGDDESEGLRVFHLCDSMGIPVATNLCAAELLVRALGRGDLAWREAVR